MRRSIHTAVILPLAVSAGDGRWTIRVWSRFSRSDGCKRAGDEVTFGPAGVCRAASTLSSMSIVSVGTIPVSALAADNTVRIAAEANLLEVARALVEADVGIVILGDDDQPVRGVVSERDVVRALAAGRDMGTTLGRDVANTDLAWCDNMATVAQVAEEMMERYVRHVLVEEDGRLVGVVSARDLLGAYASADLSTAE
jgi:CBS domain-containing protein